MEKEIRLNVCGRAVFPTAETIEGIQEDISGLEDRITRYNCGIKCADAREFFESRSKVRIPEETVMEDLLLMGFENLANEVGMAYARQVYLKKV